MTPNISFQLLGQSCVSSRLTHLIIATLTTVIFSFCFQDTGESPIAQIMRADIKPWTLLSRILRTRDNLQVCIFPQYLSKDCLCKQHNLWRRARQLMTTICILNGECSSGSSHPALESFHDPSKFSSVKCLVIQLSAVDQIIVMYSHLKVTDIYKMAMRPLETI